MAWIRRKWKVNICEKQINRFRGFVLWFVTRRGGSNEKSELKSKVCLRLNQIREDTNHGRAPRRFFFASSARLIPIHFEQTFSRQKVKNVWAITSLRLDFASCRIFRTTTSKRKISFSNSSRERNASNCSSCTVHPSETEIKSIFPQSHRRHRSVYDGRAWAVRREGNLSRLQTSLRVLQIGIGLRCACWSEPHFKSLGPSN